MSDSVIQSKEEHMQTAQEDCDVEDAMKIGTEVNTSHYQECPRPRDGYNDSDDGPSKDDTNATEPCPIEVEQSQSYEQPTATLEEEVKVGHEMAKEESDFVDRVKLAVGNGIMEVRTKNPSTLGASDLGGGMIRPHTESLEKLTDMKLSGSEFSQEIEGGPDVEEENQKPELSAQAVVDLKTPAKASIQDINNALAANGSGTEEEQTAFMKELEIFHKERRMDFRPPKFYGEPLNCLKLWKAVVKLGGYEQVTSCKLWRQVGESFRPPKTCTTVSWTFRGFYEKALLEFEKHKMRCGELPFADASFGDPSSIGNQAGLSPASGSGRARRDAAARAMQGWHSQRLLDNGEDKSSISQPKREKQIKTVGLLKRKTLSPVDHTLQLARLKTSKPQVETMVVDIGQPADWVKINVQRTKDCFEIYALVPGLLREEVRVQSDPAGRLVISGQPEQLDNHWGVTPFKKVVSLPSRIDPHQTSAVVTLHGQLFVRVPFEQSDL